MKKAVRAQNSAWSKEIEGIETKLFQQTLNEIKFKLNDALSVDKHKIYIDMTPVDVFHRLRELVEENMEFVDVEDQNYLLDLLDELKENELYSNLMNLAIFLGTLKEPETFLLNRTSEHSDPQTPSSPSPEAIINNNKLLQQQQQPKVPLNKICTTLYKLINESDGIFQFSTLIEIQRQICQHYKIDEKHDFTLLGHGDFIKFLYNHKKTIGSNLEFYLFNADSCSGIKRTDLYTFIQHLFHNGIEDRKIIEKAIKYHFNLQSLKQIGFYNIEQLCDRVKNQQQIQNVVTTMQYEELLLGNEYLNKLDTNIHRPYIRDDDHLCEYLSKCPLLVDITSWCHWNRLYMQEKGHIKEFLHRNKSKLSNMLWLEITKHNKQLVLLSKTSDIQKFEKDLLRIHLKEAAAHLLSMAIRERDCTRLPIARLRTIMKQWFEVLKQSNKASISSHDPIEHILNFLCFLPFPFSSSLVQQLILEPADHLFPNFRSILWKLARKDLVRKLHLEELGLTLGIDEWTQDLYNEETYLSEGTIDASSDETVTIMESYEDQNPREENKSLQSSIDTIHAPKKEKITTSLNLISNDTANNDSIEPLEHIKEIRKSLGKNTRSNNEDQEVVDNLQDLLGECLKKLADDLYSDQGHFVLELIQNADDNNYSKLNDNSTPKLKFIINNKQITIYNNENGFQREHVKAICSVGKSTKGKHKEGYCGHKGIGFNPMLLLFLHRLKSLEINFENHYLKAFTRYDHPGNIIELTECDGKSGKKNYWLVIKKSLPIPDTLQKKLREIKINVESTSVAIGFPLQYMEQYLRANTPVPIQPLFAYLPVRQFGFRFVLQADFEIPASRQDILQGNEWNQWLRDEMVPLLSDAYDYFRDLPNSAVHEIEWRSPAKCVIVRDPFILKILSPNLLLTYCEKYLVHEYLHDVDEKILLLLGVEKLSIHEIIKMIKKQFLVQEQSPHTSIEQIAQWLLCLHYSLEQMKYLNDIDDDTVQLKELKMIPIENQAELVSTNEMIIFFPDTKQAESTHIDQKFTKLLNDLPTIKTELFHYIKQNYPDRLQEIKELMRKFGIIEKSYDETYRLLIKSVFENENQLRGTPWERYEEEFRKNYSNIKGYVVNDFTCPEFIDIFRNSDNNDIKNLNLHYDTCHQLLLYINKKWAKIQHYFRVKIYSVGNPYPLEEVDSTFCINLKQYAWIRTQCIEYVYDVQTEKINKNEIIKLKQPSNVVVQNSDYHANAFIHYFPYIDNIKLNSDLIMKLNINNRIEPQDIIVRLLEYINDWSYTSLSNIDIFRRNEDDTKQRINTLLDNPSRFRSRRTFIESISTISRLYGFLHDELDGDERYLKWPLVFVPESLPSENTDLCVGRFLFINEVAWDDPAHLLSEPILIKRLYPNLENFFKCVLKIPLIPSSECYLKILEEYSKTNVTDQLAENTWQIFENLYKNDYDNIIKLFRHRSLIPSMTKYGWIKPDDELYAPDDKIIAQLFESERLPIIKLPEISDENVLVENSNKSVDEEILKRIGRTGERWAYEYLKNSYRTKDNVSVKWLNETFETGSPYDIEIKFIDNSQDTQRIEVKTTTKHYDNYQFSISIQEVEEILLNPNTYYIYRINLSTRSLIIIDNIKQNLSDKRQLQLQMNVLKLEDFNET
ncbi:unnamed protein product [Rotaria sp. Silwood2]|nr:unnamed protein product [Rotaria sp. Silwood2]